MTDLSAPDEIFQDERGRIGARRHTRSRRIALESDNPAIPRATYRLQLNGTFTLRDATAIVPYLARLGISHVYCSPYLRARPGSSHGYDIVDHASINPEIGTMEDLERFAQTLHAHGMGQLADIVPNHMGVLCAENLWWMDVLENGPSSQYAEFFDIDWHPTTADLANRVLVPVLGDHYGVTLERGELKLAFDATRGAFELRYFDHRFPLDPREYPQVLDEAASRLADRRSADADEAAGARATQPIERDRATDAGESAAHSATALRNLSRELRDLPTRLERSAKRIAARRALARSLRERLAQLAGAAREVACAIEDTIHSFNGIPGNAQSFDKLDRLIGEQAYRLAYWRVASSEINYRRFFNINDLAAIRVENPAVFEATHDFILQLIARGIIDGLRVDHPDGLQDPQAYFEQLQARYARSSAHLAPTDGGCARFPLYLVIEKIMAPFERVDESWAIYGTTGYRFAAVVNGLFIDRAVQRRFTRIYHAFIGDPSDWESIARRAKGLVLRSEFAAELGVLTNQLVRIARADRRTRDFTFDTLRRALTEVIAFFPVYRTYIARRVTAMDKRYINWAVTQARRSSRDTDATIFEFIRSTLLADSRARVASPADALGRAFVLRFQQLTAPVMAKAVEDTTFYIYNRLVSLNDVGGDLSSFGMTVRAFHGASLDRAKHWPHTLIATSTHDNKRSEDVRARIDVLTEMPAAWRLSLRRWSRMNRSRKQTVNDELAPSRNDEYLLYQILIGTLPLGDLEGEALARYRERIEAYMLKAVREAKVHTSWINVDEAYEAATLGFVRALLAAERNPFLESLRSTAAPIAWVGMLNSLSIVLIKLTSPGVPDIYQGNELWDFSLVDPDNRRPVDYELRAALLSDVERAPDAGPSAARIRALFASAEDGRPKMFVTQRALALRRAHPRFFLKGGYTALNARGMREEHVVAYARRHAGAGVIVIAGRLFSALIAGPGELPCGEQVWGDTWIEVPFLGTEVALENALTGQRVQASNGRVRVAEALADFPGAILVFAAGDSTP